jgi:polysaccharide biosynthesis protein PslG
MAGSQRRQLTRVLRVGAAMAIVSGTAATTPAAGQPPPSFFGVVTQTALNMQDYERMALGGIGTLRTPLPWAVLDPTPSVADLNWRGLDAIVFGTASHGIDVLPVVYGVPLWVAEREGCRGSDCETSAPRTPYGLAAWRDFLGQVAARYGPGGSFWALNPTLVPQPIRVWQIWNEQNSTGFYEPRPSVRRYAHLLRSAAEAIRSVDPGAELLLGGMYGTPPGRKAIDATEFLHGLYRRPGTRAAFDGIALHPYAGKVKGVLEQLERLDAVARQARDGGVDFWVTEIGWASAGPPNRLTKSPRGQAQRLRAAYRTLIHKRRRFGVRLVAWYSWGDAPPREAACGFCAWTGLFSDDLAPKPAWHALLGFTGGS